MVDTTMFILSGKTISMAGDFRLGVEFGTRDARRGLCRRANELSTSFRYPTWFLHGYAQGFAAPREDVLF